MLRMEISGNKRLFVGAVSENIVRVVYTGRDEVQNHSCMVEHPEKVSDLQKEEREGKMILSYGKIRAEIEKGSGTISWYRNDSGKKLLQEGEKSLTPVTLMKYQLEGEKPVIDHVHTVDGERNFIQNLIKVKDRDVYRGKLGFRFLQEEGIYGLGQGEEGIYNYRGHTQYLYQHNMRIPMPCFVSDNGYGILADCTSLMTFESQENESHFFFDAVEQMDYYFIAGDNMDEVIRGFRFLTGKAKLLPRWAYGYLQSKEAYKSQQELIDITAEYRRRQVPLDAVIQDWCSWEDGNWGEKIPVVTSDSEKGARLIAERIVASGCRNILMIEGRSYMRQPFDARGTGVKKILKDHGISVISTEIEWNIVSYEYYAQVVEKYLDLFDDVDGIYVGDLPAVACMAVAEKRGIRVPEELKIIGYDGLDIGKFVTPPLTTVKQDIPRMAKCCVDTIMRLLDGDTDIEMKQICDVEFIKGGTM